MPSSCLSIFSSLPTVWSAVWFSWPITISPSHSAIKWLFCEWRCDEDHVMICDMWPPVDITGARVRAEHVFTLSDWANPIPVAWLLLTDCWLWRMIIIQQVEGCNFCLFQFIPWFMVAVNKMKLISVLKFLFWVCLIFICSHICWRLWNTGSRTPSSVN